MHLGIISWKIMYLILWQAFSENFTGLELEDGGGRGTSGHWLLFYLSPAHSFVSPFTFLSYAACWIQVVSTLQEFFLRACFNVAHYGCDYYINITFLSGLGLSLSENPNYISITPYEIASSLLLSMFSDIYSFCSVSFTTINF